MFCDACGTKINEGSVSSEKLTTFNFYLNRLLSLAKNKKITAGIFVAIILLIIMIIALSNRTAQDKQRALQNQMVNQQLKTDQLANQLQNVQKQNLLSQQVRINRQVANSQSVVNILCDDGSGGSGTIISEDGLVLTNNHVIAKASICAVTLPDPTTGAPVSIYESEPFIVPHLSSKYDIAMLSINSSYTDSDGKTWGDYPTTFPAFNPPDCSSSTAQLGDAITIYGYPVTSGGYNLTITEGIISSFSDEGNILTSAKIDSGNSGGLATDSNGCFIGIPSAVIKGKYQNLGVIIPIDIINQFINESKLQ